MFTKLEQRSWLKIEAGRSKTARECYRGPVEVCGTAALPYRTVARWVQAFRTGRQNATDQPRPGTPSATEAQVSSVATLWETDRRWTIRELPQNRTVTGQYYDDFLEPHLRLALRKKRPHFLGENTPIILHDNAWPHVADVVNQLLARWQWEVPYHPPYSLDISPCDFDLIPKVKVLLRGRRFKTILDITDAVGRSVRTINKTGAAKGIMRLPHRWERVQHNFEEYIEGL